MAEKNIFPLFPSSNKQEIRRVAAYCRVSSDSEEQSHSLENQKEYYTSLLSDRKDCIFVGLYADEGISGTQVKNRTMFLKLIEDCKDGKIDMIITKSVSRFARNTMETLSYTRMLKKLKIDVLFEKEGIHSITHKGELMLTMLSSAAEAESKNLSNLISWGLHKKYESGSVESLSLGKFLGYDKINGKAVVNESEAITVRRIYQMYLDGLSLSQIAQRLTSEGVSTERGSTQWGVSSFKKVLVNEKYKGDALFQKSFIADPITHKSIKNTGQMDRYYVYDCFPAIIDKETWELAQLERKRREQFSKDHFITASPRSSESFPFCCKLTCAVCKHTYKINKSKHVREEQYIYYRCGTFLGNNSTKIPGMTFTPRPKPARKANPTQKDLMLRKKPQPRQMLCTDIEIMEDEPKKAFISSWNSMVDNPPAITETTDLFKSYHQKKLKQLLQETGRITEFDYWLFLKTVSHIEVQPDRSLKVIFL